MRFSGDTERTTGSAFTFVAIDEDGSSVSVPELTVETDAEEELGKEALAAEE